MPLRVLRLRNVATANVVGVLWAASTFAWFFLSALYLSNTNRAESREQPVAVLLLRAHAESPPSLTFGGRGT